MVVFFVFFFLKGLKWLFSPYIYKKKKYLDIFTIRLVFIL